MLKISDKDSIKGNHKIRNIDITISPILTIYTIIFLYYTSTSL